MIRIMFNFSRKQRKTHSPIVLKSIDDSLFKVYISKISFIHWWFYFKIIRLYFFSGEKKIVLYTRRGHEFENTVRKTRLDIIVTIGYSENINSTKWNEWDKYGVKKNRQPPNYFERTKYAFFCVGKLASNVQSALTPSCFGAIFSLN